jgi:hypothetical protein
LRGKSLNTQATPAWAQVLQGCSPEHLRLRD